MSIYASLFAFITIPVVPLVSAAPSHARSNTVEWGPCPDYLVAGPAPIECGNLTVPLDYASPNSTETLVLELVRVPAVKGPSRGSILFNFGGPGFPARPNLASRSYLLQAATGGHHDLVAWDPRGVGNTTTFSCDPKGEFALDAGPQGNSSDPSLIGRHWAVANAWSEYCLANPEAGEVGSRISTAYTARDAMRIVDALDDDGMLRYWGTSYGTILGATLAAMFPDRVDKVVLDSVVNPTQWYEGVDTERLEDADKTLLALFRECLDHGAACPLAHANSTAQQLLDRTLAFMEDLKRNPIAVGGLAVFDQTFMAAVTRPVLNDATRWPAFAAFLTHALSGNLTGAIEGLAALLAFIPNPSPDGVSNNSPDGIQCADKGPRYATLRDFIPAVDSASRASRALGFYLGRIAMVCAQWKIEPRERFGGSFANVRTKNPILVFSHGLDPSTSINGAKNVTAGFEGSVLLQTDGYGHGWRAHPSVCATRAIQKYFDQGVLPELDTVCKTDVKPFFNFTSLEDTWDGLLPQFGFDTPTKKEM
ncbi:Tripeptidyl aminopeptidase [Colletotrichum orbiculare MAFF 240422]|uniref:Tripeptidyl aminopeptidase n=1 Tax=Colletotrichum orbiculare (strain 104-T / ATCC 96160 / CBS 514.97 / LARS 414 / MAFF 240422) TaxID=1213857 RepID=N4UQN3_COLOR|nr:Tripeptidyl aminopeptidase [Colletotrichum orbiculare MAFF 240422]